MNLIERSDQLDTLRQLFAGGADSRGGVAVIQGPPGTGKTALLDEAVNLALEMGATVCTAAASALEKDLHFGVMGQLLDGELNAERLDELPDQSPVKSAERTILATCARLLELARDRPLMVVVDDLQFADVHSLQCLLALVRRARRTRLTLLLTAGNGMAPDFRMFMAEVVRERSYRNIWVCLLSPSGVEALLAGQTSPEVAADLAMGCWELTGGNPQLVRGLLEDLVAGDSTGGRAIQHAFVSCLYQFEPEIRTVAQGLAILEDAGQSGLLGELLMLDAKTVDRAVEELTEAGLLKAGRLRHPQAGSVLLSALSRDERRALHARAADLLWHSGFPAPVVAVHLVAADAVGTPELINALREAAERELAAGRSDQAAEYLRLALRSTKDRRTIALLTARSAKAGWQHSPHAGQRYLAGLAHALGAGCLDRADAIGPICYLLWHGRVREAAEALVLVRRSESGTSVSGREGDLRKIEAWAARLYPELARGREGADATGHHFYEPMDMLFQLLEGTADDETALANAEHVLGSGPLNEASFVPVLLALITLVCTDDAEQAVVQCQRALRDIADGAPTWRAIISVLLATALRYRGDLRGAEFYAREAIRLISLQDWGALAGVPLAELLATLTANGRFDAVEQVLRMPLPDSAPETPFNLRYLLARGRHYMMTGRLELAIRDYQTCADLARRLNADWPALVPWRLARAEAHLLRGEREAARALVVEHLDRLAPSRSRSRGIALRILGTASDLPERRDLMSEAVALLNASGDRFMEAVATADLGRTLAELGEKQTGRRLQHAALRLAEECHADRLVFDVCEEIAVRESVESTGKSLLSDAELRVASLAADGHSNKMIASTFFLTVSTVEQHLTSAYRKLEIAGRSDLPLALGIGLSNRGSEAACSGGA